MCITVLDGPVNDTTIDFARGVRVVYSVFQPAMAQLGLVNQLCNCTATGSSALDCNCPGPVYEYAARTSSFQLPKSANLLGLAASGGQPCATCTQPLDKGQTRGIGQDPMGQTIKGFGKNNPAVQKKRRRQPHLHTANIFTVQVQPTYPYYCMHVYIYIYMYTY